MKALWITIGIIVLIAIIYWLYKRSKTVEVVSISPKGNSTIMPLPGITYVSSGVGTNNTSRVLVLAKGRNI